MNVIKSGPKNLATQKGVLTFENFFGKNKRVRECTGGGEIMSRYIMLLLTGFVSVFTLNSCATPETQDADAVTSGNVVLEDLGNGVCYQVKVDP